ncbi:MAG: biotin/lipoyl-containing protein [Polyangiaceae bacterium]
MSEAGGRVFERTLTALTREHGDKLVIVAPQPGKARGGPALGALVQPLSLVGELEVLGVLYLLRADANARGIVVARPGNEAARRNVGYGDVLFELDPNVGAGAEAVTEQATQAATHGEHFRAPSSGRFYSRPAPGKAPFIEVGDTLVSGTPVALLEVMKTFNRITYGGAGLPERARVVRVLVDDGADVEMGQPLLEIEALPSS